MILLFPVGNCRFIVSVLFRHAHPDWELCSHTHDFQLNFALIRFTTQHRMLCFQVAVQITEGHQTAPLACHPAGCLMCRKAGISNAAEVDVILHSDIVVTRLNCHIDCVEIVGIAPVLLPPTGFRRCQMQEQFILIGKSLETRGLQIFLCFLCGRNGSDQTGLAIIQIFRDIGQKSTETAIDFGVLLKQTRDQCTLGIGKINGKVSHFFREPFDIHL